MHTVQLILASTSPRRKKLLTQIGLVFTIHPSSVDEPPHQGNAPADYARSLAHLKAETVAQQFPDALIIGADTIVVVDDQVLGKPDSVESATDMLRLLSDRTHQVITAYSLQLKNDDIVKNCHVTTQVHFRPLGTQEINDYIRSGAPFDKAGGYGIQDSSSVFVDYIEGCFYNVVGFPLSDFNTTLTELQLEYAFELSK